ncbi:LysR family regulator CbbR [Aliiroseovarius subalbicans]|uniref:LysR family regulator CbbR n=1 Tax=Aliiroseovarius subalbicans TaxID=2925840 RepID=UPI001F5A52E0|nr:LysR family transcriptional regulator [Aliiroseovarius subalbicans]MCI2399892.1 LysR family transcriptional regulator [Aliiroseovarius subalbicans]
MPRPDAITFKQLRALEAVERYGTITRAAEAIRLTPPAVHTQLRQLAENMKADMLRRGDSGRMELTDEGRLVLASARRIGTELETCMKSVAALRDGHAGLVRLGVVSTGKYFAPALVARLKREFPDIKVELTVGNRQQIIAALDARQVQLAIMGRPPRAPENTSVLLGPHPHLIITAPDHPLAQDGPVDPRALLKETLIGREEGSGTRILMTRFLDRIGEGRPYDCITMSSNETIKQAVIAGLGIALISQHTVVEELHAGRLVALTVPGLPIERAWYLLHRSDDALSAAAKRIKSHVAGLKGSFLPQV